MNEKWCHSPLGKSDHAVLTFTFNAYLDGSYSEKIIYKYDKADYKKMTEMMTLDWNSVLENSSVDKQWQCFYSKLLSVVDECVPKIYVKPSQNRRIIRENKKLMSKVKQKQRLWNRHIKNGDETANKSMIEYVINLGH